MKLLASPKFTTVLLLLLFVVVLAQIKLPGNSHWLAIPLVGLIINLLAVIIFTHKLRANLYLLVFHLGLIILTISILLNTLTTKDGSVEVVEGGDFSGQLTRLELGKFDISPLDTLRFRLDAVDIRYNPAGERIATFARLTVKEPDQNAYPFVVTDQHPLVYNSNRFYITANKGFALIIGWTPATANQELIGNINLPSYPANQLKQNIDWQPPESDETYHLFLEFEKDPLAIGSETRFQPPEEPQLIIRGDNDLRVTLEENQRIKLKDGELHFLGVRSWMGFKVKYDKFSSWILAACLICILSLTGFYFDRRKHRPPDSL